MTPNEVRSDLKVRPHRSKRYPRCRGLRISRRYFAAHEYCQAKDTDLTGISCTSGSEREFILEGSWYADQEIQAGADRDAAAAG